MSAREGNPKLNDVVPPPTTSNTPVHSEVARLIETEYRGLIGLVRSKLRDRDLAADLVNEAIVVTLEHAKSGRLARTDQIGGYVFTVSMNLLRNHQRNSDNRQDLRSSVDELNAVAIHDRDVTEDSELRRKAQHVLESLSSIRDREVIKRFYFDEDDRQVICTDLGLTPLQFTQVISRARKRMKAIFDLEGLKREDLLSATFFLIFLTPFTFLICRTLATYL